MDDNELGIHMEELTSKTCLEEVHRIIADEAVNNESSKSKAKGEKSSTHPLYSVTLVDLHLTIRVFRVELFSG